MDTNTEPYFKKASCSYCGDAPANHTLFYVDSAVSAVLDPIISRVARRSPGFLKKFSEWLPTFTFKAFMRHGMARFSDDIEKANTFRSRVIWEEARRRGVVMEQLVLWGKHLEFYRAFLPQGGKAREEAKEKEKEIFFNSLPIPPKYLEFSKEWDNKLVLKEEFQKHGIPIPKYFELPLRKKKRADVFKKIEKPFIVKPKLGSRGRHTITNIRTLEEMEHAVRVGRALSPFLIAEEHLRGYVCRATVVGGVLAGFYRGEAPVVIGDGQHSVQELIEDKNNRREARVEKIVVGEELRNHILRQGLDLSDVPPRGFELSLSHRVGRLFGGATREMWNELHPGFVPIFEKAAAITGLGVAGFDCIIPDPTEPPETQKWGIIECNTLPYIDLHYYALEGKPKNIAGMIWDLWNS